MWRRNDSVLKINPRQSTVRSKYRGRIGLNWKCGIGMNAAREKVRIANALADLPNTSATFARGEISYSKVRAMTRVATPENEDYLLMIAKHGTGHHMETLVRMYRRTKRLQEMDECRKQHDERELHVYYEPDGSLVFHARMPAEKGALLLKAIELAADQAEKDVSAETSHRDGFDRCRADALADVAASYLAHGPGHSSSADRYQVILHVSAETLTNNEGDLSHLEDGPHVSAETSRRLCCDAGVSVLSEDENGNTLNIGRKTRIIPPAMRRALRARDEGCHFPGCTHKHYIDGTIFSTGARAARPVWPTWCSFAAVTTDWCMKEASTAARTSRG